MTHADQQWLAQHLHPFFADVPLPGSDWAAADVERLANEWVARYEEVATEQSLAAGSWLVALSWLLAIDPPQRFAARWYEQLVAFATAHPGQAIGLGVASALAIHLAGDSIWPTSFRLIMVKAVMALSAGVLLVPGREAHRFVDEAAGCWVLRDEGGRWRLARVVATEVTLDRDWVLDWGPFLTAIERFVRRLGRSAHDGEPPTLLWWGQVDLLERLRLADRRVFRQLVNQLAMVVGGLGELMALAAGRGCAVANARVIECSDLAAGLRLLFPPNALVLADGDLLAVRLSDRRPHFPAGWMVGVVRWQTHKPQGTLMGVQLFAPLAHDVRILYEAREGMGGVDTQRGLLLFRQLPRYPQPLIVVPRAEHLSGRWWLVEESPLFTLQVRRFQPGRIHVVTPHAAVFDLWPKEG